jgi:hypothetical protein
MADQIRVIAVPHHLADEVERALGAIRDQVKAASPNVKDSDIVLERQAQRGMVGGFGGEALLYVGGLVAATITKKWIEEVLWPRIKPTIARYSDDVFDLLLQLAGTDD